MSSITLPELTIRKHKHSFLANPTAALPNSMRDYLAAVQTRIEEELAFSDGSTIYKRMVALEGSQDIQGECMHRKRAPPQLDRVGLNEG